MLGDICRGYGGLSELPWEADVGSVAVVDSGAEIEVAAAAPAGTELGVSVGC